MKVDKDQISAWGVHAFTGSGAILGFLALVSILNNDQVGSFLWLGMALLIDGVDGTLARKARVSEVTPNINGAVLDNIVDYFTYVIIPALMVYWFGMVPEGWELIASSAILLVSCYTFANVHLKTEDFYFTGFPALWNVVVLYFTILETSETTNIITIGILSVLTFVPFKVVHPLRVLKWRKFTVIVSICWALCCLFLLLEPPEHDPIAYSIFFWMWIAMTGYFLFLTLSRTLLVRRLK